MDRCAIQLIVLFVLLTIGACTQPTCTKPTCAYVRFAQPRPPAECRVTERLHAIERKLAILRAVRAEEARRLQEAKHLLRVTNWAQKREAARFRQDGQLSHLSRFISWLRYLCCFALLRWTRILTLRNVKFLARHSGNAVGWALSVAAICWLCLTDTGLCMAVCLPLMLYGHGLVRRIFLNELQLSQFSGIVLISPREDLEPTFGSKFSGEFYRVPSGDDLREDILRNASVAVVCTDIRNFLFLRARCFRLPTSPTIVYRIPIDKIVPLGKVRRVSSASSWLLFMLSTIARLGTHTYRRLVAIAYLSYTASVADGTMDLLTVCTHLSSLGFLDQVVRSGILKIVNVNFRSISALWQGVHSNERRVLTTIIKALSLYAGATRSAVCLSHLVILFSVTLAFSYIRTLSASRIGKWRMAAALGLLSSKPFSVISACAVILAFFMGLAYITSGWSGVLLLCTPIAAYSYLLFDSRARLVQRLVKQARRALKRTYRIPRGKTGVYYQDYSCLDLSTLHLITYGTRGDFDPFHYLCAYLQSIGVRAKVTSPQQQDIGQQDLGLIEQGNVYVAGVSASRVNKLISLLDRLDAPTISNAQAAMSCTNGIRLGLSVSGSHYGVTTGSVALDLVSAGAGLVHAGVAGFDATLTGMPHPSQGLIKARTALMDDLSVLLNWNSVRQPKVRSLKWLENMIVRGGLHPSRILIATGSSSELPPMPYFLKYSDIHISSRSWLPESNGTVVADPAHSRVMQDYFCVVTHGGAGTVWTALAAGCHVVSVKDNLDRSLVPGDYPIPYVRPELSCLATAYSLGLSPLGLWPKTPGQLARALLAWILMLPGFALQTSPLKTLRLCLGVLSAASAISTLLAFIGRVDSIMSAISGMSLLYDRSAFHSPQFKMIWDHMPIPTLGAFFDLATSVWMPGSAFSILFSTIERLWGSYLNLHGIVAAMATSWMSYSPLHSQDTYVELWTTPVLGIWEHTAIKCGDRFFDFEVDMSIQGTPLRPLIRMRTTRHPPIHYQHARIYRTTILATNGPSQQHLNKLKQPVAYSVFNNCQSGALAWLRGCKTFSLSTTVRLLYYAFKSHPWLAFSTLLTFIPGLGHRTDPLYILVGIEDAQLRRVKERVRKGFALTDEEVVILLLNRQAYEATDGRAGGKIRPFPTIKGAFAGSKLWPEFKYSKEMAVFQSTANKIELTQARTKLLKLVAKIANADSDPRYTPNRTGIARVTPKIILRGDNFEALTARLIVEEQRKRYALGNLLSDPAGALMDVVRVLPELNGDAQGLKQYMFNKSYKPDAKLDTNFLLSGAQLNSEAAMLDPASQCLLIALCLRKNVVLYKGEKDKSRKGEGESLSTQRVAATTVSGVIFDQTLHIVMYKGSLLVVNSGMLEYDVQVGAAAAVTPELQRYVEAYDESWFDLHVWRYFPRRWHEMLIDNPGLYKDLYSLASYYILAFMNMLERYAISILRLLLIIFNIRALWGAQTNDVATRIKPSVPATNVPLYDEHKFVSVEALGLDPFPKSPKWEYDEEREDILIHPRFMEQGRDHWEAEDIIGHHMERCNAVLATQASDWKLDYDLRRRFNTVPATDKWLTYKRAFAVHHMQAEIGINNIEYATPHNTRISLERYQRTPRDYSLTEETIREYADLIHRQNLPEYKGFRLWSPENSLRSLKRKMGLGYGFEGATSASMNVKRGLKKRSDLLKFPKAKQAFLDQVRKELRDPDLKPMVHSAFPKAYKYFKEKLEEHPEKLRTIVAPDIFSLVADACFFKSTDLEMKRNWKESATAIGLPWKAIAINDMLGKLPPGNQNFVLDMSDYDSTHPQYVPKLLRALYQPGFDSVSKEDQEIIGEHIEKRWQRLQEGGLIYDLNHGIKIPKVRGSSTGSVSVTRPNVEVAKFALTVAFAKLWDVSIETAMEKLKMNTMGDDGMVTHTGPLVDKDELVQTVRDVTGLSLTVEFEKSNRSGVAPSWDGATYLSHTIKDAGNYAEELEEAGIPRNSPMFPDYVILYDPRKLAMRQTVSLRKPNIFHEYDSLKSYMQKAIHFPHLHAALKALALELVPSIMSRKNGSKFLAKRPLLDYGEELRLFYTKLYKTRIYNEPYVNRGLLAYQTFVNVNLALTSFAAFARASAIHSLGSPRPLETSSPLFQDRMFTIESFAFQSHVDLTGCPPDFQTFQKLCGGNPFASCTDPAMSWEYLNRPSKYPLIAEQRKVAYYKYQWLSITFILIRYIISSLTKLNLFFNIINMLYTVTFGMPGFWWGMASELGTLAHNHASAKLSSYVPRDPYRLSKALALIIVDALPFWVFQIGVPRAFFQITEQTIIKLLDIITFHDKSLGTSAFTGGTLQGDMWRQFFTTDIAPALKQFDRITVHAPTGSGKSQALGNLLLDEFDRVFYVVPRRAAAAGMSGFQQVQRGVKWPQKRGKYVMTAGHMLYRWWKDSQMTLDNSIVCFDEYDELDPNQLIVGNELRKIGAKFILLSATPSEVAITALDAGYKVCNVPVQAPFKVQRFAASELSTLVTLCAANYHEYNHILIICASLGEATALSDSLSTMDFDASVFASGMAVPTSKVVVATQVAEKSITIPGIDLVLDSGVMIRSDRGILYRSYIDFNTMIQRSGRTGRTCDGTYITMHNPSGTQHFSYPSPEVALAFPASCRELWKLEIEPSILIDKADCTSVNQCIRVLNASVPALFQQEATIRLIASLVLAAADTREFIHLIDQIIVDSDESKLDWIFAQHADTLTSLGVKGLNEMKEFAEEIMINIRFEISQRNRILRGNYINLVNYEIFMFRTDGKIEDRTGKIREIFQSDLDFPPDENLPNNLGLVRFDPRHRFGNNWYLQFIGQLTYYRTGQEKSIYDANETSTTEALLDMYEVDNYTEPGQVFYFMSLICSLLQCEVTLVDCSEFIPIWYDLSNMHSKDLRLNIIWTKSGQLRFFRATAIYPVRHSKSIVLDSIKFKYKTATLPTVSPAGASVPAPKPQSTSKAIPSVAPIVAPKPQISPSGLDWGDAVDAQENDMNASLPSEPLPASIAPKQYSQEINYQNLCAFKAVASLFINIPQNKEEVNIVDAELRGWCNAPSMNSQAFVQSLAESLATKFADLRDNQGLTSASELLWVMGQRGPALTLPQRQLFTQTTESGSPIISSQSEITPALSIYVLNELGGEIRTRNRVIMIESQAHTADLINQIGRGVIFSNSLSSIGQKYQIAGFMHFEGLHWTYFSYREQQQDFINNDGRTIKIVKGHIGTIVLRAVEEVEGSSSASTADSTRDILDHGPVGGTLILPRAEELQAHTIDHWGQHINSLAIHWAPGSEVECTLAVCDYLIKAKIDPTHTFQDTLALAMTSLRSGANRQSSIIRATHDMLNLHKGIGILHAVLKDDRLAIGVGYRTIKPSTSGKYIMVASYLQHMYIMGLNRDLHSRVHLSGAEVSKSETPFRVYWHHESTHERVSSQFEEAVTIKEQLTNQDMRALAKDRLLSKQVATEQVRQTKLGVKSLLECKQGGDVACEGCRRFTTLASCSSQNTILYFSSHKQYALLVDQGASSWGSFLRQTTVAGIHNYYYVTD